MKKTLTSIITTLVLFHFFTSVSAQTQGYCGSELSDKQKGWLLDFQKNKDNFISTAAAQNYIPLYLHIVGQDEGTGYYSAEQLMKDVCQLNVQYAPVGFYFYLAGVQYIPNTTYYDHDFGSGYSMMLQHNKPSVANAYIVQNPADNCGYFSPSADGVALGKGCMGTGQTTMAHEFGHFFSLPHPFENVLGQKEYVNGTNCKVGGDLFCDTRADILNARWQCPYTGSAKDPLGQTYNPDGTLYMSYSNDACANRFSTEQIAAVKYNLATQRTDLDGFVQDTMPNTAKVLRLLPAQGMAVQPTKATFVWKSVPGAQWYVIQASPVSVFPGNLPVDVITSDTTYTATNLSNSRTYKWRVRPIFAGRTCTQFGDTGSFFTSTTAGIDIAEMGREVNLYPNPTANGQEVMIAFTNETEQAQFTLYTLDGKGIPATAAQVNTTTYSISTAGIKPGVYLLDITNGNQQYRKKLLVE